jgi:hypothetical protein
MAPAAVVKVMLLFLEAEMAQVVQLDLFGVKVEFIQIMYLMFKE